MATIYSTKEYKGYGKQNYYHNEYRVEDEEVSKVKCHRQKFFNGDENEWSNDERVEQTWSLDDPDLPEWLHKYL